MDYDKWCSLSDDELRDQDVGLMNLLAAEGLPGSEQLDVRSCCQKLDEWAGLVKLGTERMWPKFQQAPSQYGDTEGQFRILVMVTVLQRNLGVRYNPDCMAGPVNASDSRTQFIHGILAGQGGTCVSLPVLYLAIGRRLGYPLHLVEAKEHYFVRWEEPAERFNIECTSQGFDPKTDEHFRSWPRPLSRSELDTGIYLRNMTPREELAAFLFERGHCWLDNLQVDRALEAYQHAQQLYPAHLGYCEHTTVASVMRSLIDPSRPFSPADRWAIPRAEVELARIHMIHGQQNPACSGPLLSSRFTTTFLA